METKDALQLLGLSDKEAAVYLALLQLGRAPAYSIATKSGLKRPTTYVILEELIKKGLVVQIPREKKQLYVARPPEEAFALAQERLDLAKKKLPEILALTKGEATKVNTIYFEGIAGIKQILEYRAKDLEGKETVAFWATDHNAPKELRDYFKKDYVAQIKKGGGSTRAIAPLHENLHEYRVLDATHNRKVKTVPYEQYSSEVSIDTVGDVVRVQDFKNLQGIVIENEEVAKTVREIFEMLWQRI